MINQQQLFGYSLFCQNCFKQAFLFVVTELVRLNLGILVVLFSLPGRGCSESEVAQSCLSLCDHMDGSLHQAPPSMGFSRQEY